MIDTSKPVAIICQRCMRLALKEILAQQPYRGVVPEPPDYQAVVCRARELERTMSHRTHLREAGRPRS